MRNNMLDQNELLDGFAKLQTRLMADIMSGIGVTACAVDDIVAETREQNRDTWTSYCLDMQRLFASAALKDD